MFKQHGLFYLGYEHNIIIFIAEGAWNIEATRHAIGKIKHIVDNLAYPSHAFIFDTSKVEGMTPDSFKAWSEAISYWLEAGFKALVRVTDPKDSHYKLFIEPFDLRLKTLIPLIITNDLTEGLNWLHQLGFSGFEQGFKLADFDSNN